MRFLSHPLRLVVFLLLFGISLHNFFPVTFPLSIAVTSLFLLFYIFTLFLRRLLKLRLLVASLIIISLGYTLISLSEDSRNSKGSIVDFVPNVGGKVICQGRIQEVKYSEDKEKYLVDKLKCLEKSKLVPLTGKVRLTVRLQSSCHSDKLAENACHSRESGNPVHSSSCTGLPCPPAMLCKAKWAGRGVYPERSRRAHRNDKISASGTASFAGMIFSTVPTVPCDRTPRTIVLQKGDLIRFKAYIRRPRDFKNYDRAWYEIYCLSKGISAVGYIPSPAWIAKVGTDASLLQKKINSWRRRVRDAIDQGIGRKDENWLIAALILGDKSGLKEDQLDDFRMLGVVHLLVVSGLHVAVLAGISWWLIILIGSIFSLFMGQRDMRPIASLLSLLLIWAFIALTGFGTPAFRAGIIATIYLGSILIRKSHDAWDSLALAAIVIIVANPGSIFDISFQLTFAAVVGILVFSKYFLKAKEEIGYLRKSIYFISNMALVSIGAFVGVLPLLAYHFGKIPLVGPLVSIVLSPIVTITIVPLSLFAAILTPISSSMGAHLFGLLQYPSSLLLSLSAGLADVLDWTVVDMKIGLRNTLILYVLIILIIYWRNISFRKTYAVALVICGGIGIIMSQPLDISEEDLAVTFLDVGQGASVVLRLPGGKVILVDGGGIKGSSFDLGAVILDPFLKKIGVDKIDKIIVTHPHSDHFKGLGYVVENYGPTLCLIGNYPEHDMSEEDVREWAGFLEIMKNAGVEIEHLKPSSWEEGDIEFSVFSPPMDIPLNWSVNDASAIIRIEYEDVSFLLTGDIESIAEMYIVENDLDLTSTIMQVPHHGSATSSSDGFLDQVSPKYAVIQVGAFNKYGFPEEEVLRRLEERDIKTYRTDIDGAVTFVTDGSALKTFLGEKR